MRKVVVYLFMSLDGVVEEPSDWAVDFVDEGLFEEIRLVVEQQDAVLLGGRTYAYWAPHWPTAEDEPFATFINTTPKYIVSTSLQEPLAWQNSTLVQGDLSAAVNQLKQQPGKNIGVHASPTLVRTLLALDLVDELRLVVFPVIAGRGMRFSTEESALKKLKLVETKRTASGIVILAYATDLGE